MSVSSSLYARAKYEAVEELISNYPVEYEAILKASKLRYGITPHKNKAERIAMHEQIIANLRSV